MSTPARSKKRKRKRGNELALDPEAERRIDAVVRARTRMVVKDHAGNTAVFRSTIYEKEDDES